MKAKYLAFTIALAGTFLFSSCIKEDWGVIPETETAGTNGNEWNKNKTIDFYYVSALDDNTADDYNAIGSYIKGLGDACTAAIVERTDVVNYPWLGWSTNLSSKLAIAANRFPSFALNRYTDYNIEGSTILFNHKINSAQSFKVAQDCWIKLVPIQAKSAVEAPVAVETPLATVRFTSAEQISAASAALNTLASNTYQALIIGTVKSDLVSNLEQVAGGISGDTFTQVTKDEGNDYQIFVLGPKSWVVRETQMANVSGNIKGYKISIEASVE